MRRLRERGYDQAWNPELAKIAFEMSSIVKGFEVDCFVFLLVAVVLLVSTLLDLVDLFAVFFKLFFFFVDVEDEELAGRSIVKDLVGGEVKGIGWSLFLGANLLLLAGNFSSCTFSSFFEFDFLFFVMVGEGEDSIVIVSSLSTSTTSASSSSSSTTRASFSTESSFS